VFQSGGAAEKAETQATLLHALETALRALHPYMPFITEELWQRLPRPASRPRSVALAPYPTAADGASSPSAERDMSVLMAAVSAARSARSEHEVHPSARVPLELRATDAATRAVLEREAAAIEFLVGTDGAPRVAAPGGERPRGSLFAVAGDIEVLVGLRGLVEPQKERERIERQIKKTEKDVGVLEKRLANANFAANAPPEVVAEARAQLEQLKRQKGQLAEALKLADELE
jgi:valyl-tRNA synthetase